MTRWHAVSAAGRYRANAVAPGITRTPRLGDITAGAYGRDVLARTPLGRLGEAQDMARAILFLLSPAAAFVNGQTLVVDGGGGLARSEEHTSELQSLMRNSYAVFCL